MTRQPDRDQELKHLWARAYQTAFKVLANREDAEDVAVETLARYCAQRKAPPDVPAAWVTKVAANLAIDTWRRERTRRNRLAGPVGALSGHEEPYSRVDLLHELAALAPRQRDTLIHRYFFDLSEQETAARLGVSPGSVKQHTSRGLATLRRNAKDQER